MRSSKLFALAGLCFCLLSFTAHAVTYEYDDYNRLRKALYDDGSVIEYIYDNAGNRLTRQIIPAQPSRLDIEVKTSHGNLLQNVRVYAFTSAGAYLGLQSLTDSQGLASFEHNNFQPGQYKFRVDYLGNRFWTGAIPIPGTARYSLVIAVETLSVTVEVAGAPKAGVKVYLFSEAESYLGVSAVTDDQGRVDFDLPVDGTFKFRADAMGSQYWSGAVLVIHGNNAAVTVNAGGGTLTLTLEKATGMPLSGVKTYAFTANGSYLGLTKTSAADGQSAFILSQGQYKIRSDYLGYQFWSEPVSVTQDLNQTQTIPHQDVGIQVKSGYDNTLTPKPGLKTYLFNPANAYLGISRVTDDQGQVNFNLPEVEYKVRVDYLTKQYWTEPFTWQNLTLTIPEGLARVLVTGLNQPLAGLKVYAFNAQGAYLGFVKTTDSQGLVEFQLPEGQYKFRADYLSNQYWSDLRGIEAHIVNPVNVFTGGGNFVLSVYRDENTPLTGVKCYLFNNNNAYLGQQANTNDQGRVQFNPGNGIYKIRVDYLGYQYWTAPFNIPEQTGLDFSIAHQDVRIQLGTRYLQQTQLLKGVQTYLFTPQNAYLGQSATTDDQGLVAYHLPEKTYKVRLDYLGYQYWTEPFVWLSQALELELGQAVVHVTQAGQSVPNVKVYLFKPGNTYMGLSQTTDSDGVARFLLPAQAYKFRADYNGSQFWSDEVTVTVQQENQIEVAME